jgi:hypothetical protein
MMQAVASTTQDVALFRGINGVGRGFVARMWLGHLDQQTHIRAIVTKAPALSAGVSVIGEYPAIWAPICAVMGGFRCGCGLLACHFQFEWLRAVAAFNARGLSVSSPLWARDAGRRL